MNTQDKDLVIQAIIGMFNATDKKDWDGSKSHFIEKPFIDYSSLSAIPGGTVAATDLINGWKSMAGHFKFTLHTLSNFEVVVKSDSATAFFYGHAMHQLPHAKGGDMWEAHGSYDAALVRTSAGWKISSLTFHLKYDSGNKNLRALAMASPIEQRVSFVSEGETLAGNLIIPASYQEGQKLPLIMVFGAWTQVKEQIQYVYGRKLAAEGFAVLNFDFRYWGESGGQPRYFESTDAKVKDVLNAIEYIKKHPVVDPSAISLIGVCAGAGIVARAATQSQDVKQIATVAAWLQHPATTPLFYGGEEGIKNRIALANAAQQQYEASGKMEYVEAYNSNNPRAAMFFPLDYYGNPTRGRIPEWDNQFAVTGWKEWLTMNLIDGVAEKIRVPLIMVHSDGSALPGNVRKFYEKVATSNKQLVWQVGEHTQYYDDDAHIDSALAAIIPFFKGNN